MLLKRGTPLCGHGDNKCFRLPDIYRGDLEWKQKTLKLQN